MLKRIFFTLGISTLLLLPAQSMAQTAPTLPASSGAASIRPDETHSWGVNTWSPAQTVTLNGQTSSAKISVGGSGPFSTGGPYVFATALNPQYNTDAYPTAYLAYYFEVYGSANKQVSINASGIIGSILNSTSSNSHAEAYLDVYSVDGTGTKFAEVAACVTAISCTGYNQTPSQVSQIFAPGTAGYVLNPLTGAYQANYDINFTVSTNTVYEIMLGAYVGIAGNGAIPGSGTSYIDPTLTISPSFLSSNPGYQIAFSQGISQASSAVPEPSTWVMMLIGFAGIGFAGFRRAKRETTALATE